MFNLFLPHASELQCLRSTLQLMTRSHTEIQTYAAKNETSSGFFFSNIPDGLTRTEKANSMNQFNIKSKRANKKWNYKKQTSVAASAECSSPPKSMLHSQVGRLREVRETEHGCGTETNCQSASPCLCFFNTLHGPVVF